MPNRRPQLELVAQSASPEEAAAIVAALERFMRATAPPPAGERRPREEWLAAAIVEGVDRDPGEVRGHPWINT